MRKLKEIIYRTLGAWACLVAGTATMVGCIDEDLSDCGNDYALTYTVKLETTLDVKLNQELSTVIEREMGQHLQAALSNVFTEHAHDVSLMFFGEDSTCMHSEVHYPDASEVSFSLYLPIHEYMHLAVANNEEASNFVEIAHNNFAPHTLLRSMAMDTVPSHVTGLFTTRMPMYVKDYDQEFHAHLYMQNCATVLVLDPNDVEVKDVRGAVLGVAHDFLIRDSIYCFPTTDIPVRAERLQETGNRLKCLYSVNFPSHNYPLLSRSDDKQTAAWRYHVYVTLSDGSVTETTLYFKEPLQAGDLRIVKGSINNQGAIVPNDPEVGVSIELNWNQGGVFNPEL